MSFFLISVVALATYFDLKYRRIPNWLTYPTILLALIFFDKVFIPIILLGIITALIFGKYIGSGDIKLSIAIALWSHILSWSQYWIYAALILGALFGVVFRQKRLPFAPFIAAGILIANVARSYSFL
jgi:prepilin signal peptidase PulO-like enzyme (type II secretory pathway)